MSKVCMAEIGLGGIQFDHITWEIEPHAENGVAFVNLKFDCGGLTMTFTFTADRGEDFATELRDAIVSTKEERIEWETDTAAGECDD